MAGSLAAASARAQVITDLGQAHATTPTMLLAVLRSRRLSDVVARRTAVELAAGALLDLKGVVDRDHALSAEQAHAAFAVLKTQLADLVRHRGRRRPRRPGRRRVPCHRTSRTRRGPDLKIHVRNILDKLDVSSRGEAAALVRDLSLEPMAHPSA